MDSSNGTHQSDSRVYPHRIWTRHGERRFAPGQFPSISESDRTSDDSSVDENRGYAREHAYVASQQDNEISGAGNIGRIVGLVSSYWDDHDKPSTPSGDRAPMFGSGFQSQSDRVGYLDPLRGFASSVFSPPSASNAPITRASSSSSSSNQQYPSKPRPPLPQEVRMITHSDAILRPDVPVPAPIAVPNVSESPLSLLAAATGGTLDLQWLESFDNVTLESLVPRDPVSGRPLTIGSMEHADGKCRPCIFFLKAKCFKGLRCTFCHFNHATLRKQVPVPDAVVAPASQPGTGSKSKRLRPSKRTREMIKQINEQMLFDEVREDPYGPPLSAAPTTASPPTVHPYR